VDTLSSPERIKGRVTYSGKAKRKRGSERYVEETSGSPSENDDGDGVMKEDSAAMPPPPGPPAKKARSVKAKQASARNSEDSPATKSKPESKVNKRSSISSFSDIKGSPSSMKPPSTVGSKVIKPLSSQRFQTPDAERDDISVADSSKPSQRKERTEAQRMQFFKDQPECREVEPYRAFCTGCNEWVSLNLKKTYTMQPWLKHRRECRDKLRQARSLDASTTSKSPQKEEEEESEDEASIVHSVTDKAIRRSVAQRQAYLEADPRAEVVKPHEVLCRTCQRWIKLGKLPYGLSNWTRHHKSCSGSLPSSRVANAERKLKLVNDSMARAFTVKSVECDACDAIVDLEGEGDYNLTKWTEHKMSCRSAYFTSEATSTAQDAQSTVSVESPRRAEKMADRPPPSVASTETTAVASEAAGSSRRKRAREDEDGDEVEEPPRARARTESYKPSGALGWLLLPFKSFINGFKEGLQPPRSSST